MLNPYLSILIVVAVIVGFVIFAMVTTHCLGPKRGRGVKSANFECGIESVGDARTPFSVVYFLVAILFVLFDVEVVFLYPWAVNFRELGWMGLIEMGFFLLAVVIGLAYVKRYRVLDLRDE